VPSAPQVGPTLLPTAIECAWYHSAVGFLLHLGSAASAESSWARSLLTKHCSRRVVDEWRTPGRPGSAAVTGAPAATAPRLRTTPEEIIADFRTFYFETALSGFRDNLWPSKTSCAGTILFGTDFPAVSPQMAAGTRPTSNDYFAARAECSRRSWHGNANALLPRLSVAHRAADPPHSSQRGNRRPSHNTCCGPAAALRVSTRLLLAGTNRCQLWETSTGVSGDDIGSQKDDSVVAIAATLRVPTARTLRYGRL